VTAIDGVALLDLAAELLASVIDLVILVVITIGTLRALKAIAAQVIHRKALAEKVREIWLHYAGWIVLALELALAADLIRTAIEPSWQEIAQLAAIGAIRTALAWFVACDIPEFNKDPSSSEAKG
jgi:uncharacterized membrane protein